MTDWMKSGRACGCAVYVKNLPKIAILGNFAPNETVTLLREMRVTIGQRDAVLIGTDLCSQNGLAFQ